MFKNTVGLVGLTFFVAFLSTTTLAQRDKTIVLVRHVEKDSSPAADKVDPELSAEGKARAERLAKIVKRYKPHEIFSTPFKRTRGTAEPIAKRRKKEIQTYDPSKPADLVQKIMDPASKTVHYLIVGHSNTIPAIVAALGGPRAPDYCESQYATLVIMHFSPNKAPRTIRASYGAADPPAAADCHRSMR